MKVKDQETSFSIDCDAMCKTEHPKSLKYRFVWVIEKFSELSQPTGEFIESCDLIFKGSCDIERKWRMKVYPNGITSRYNGNVSVDLIFWSKCNVNATYKLSTLDKSKKLTNNNVEGQHEFGEGYYANNSALYSFAVKSLLEEQLQPDDTLTIVCDITEEPTRRTLSMAEQMWMKNGNPMMLFDNVYHKDFVKDMNNVFMKEDNGHDVVINCGDKVFYCHKFMLSARSQVFHAMLKSDMMENKSGSVDVHVEDVLPNVMIEMLQYIYSGCTLAIDKYGRELLAVAEKYQLNKLKNCCEDYLGGTLDVENCLDLLLLGDLNQAKTLKDAALEFFSKNLGSFKEGEWKKRLNDHPVLAIEVMEYLFSKKINI